MNDMEYERLMEVLNDVDPYRRTPDFMPKEIYGKPSPSPWVNEAMNNQFVLHTQELMEEMAAQLRKRENDWLKQTCDKHFPMAAILASTRQYRAAAEHLRAMSVERYIYPDGSQELRANGQVISELPSPFPPFHVFTDS